MSSDQELKVFLEENFRAGEYAALTILVKLEEVEALVEVLKNSGLTLAVIPKVQAQVDFESKAKGGMTQ